MSRLLTPGDVSERTGFAEKTLANWRSLSRSSERPVGPPSLRIGKSVRYDEEALGKWIDEQRQ